MLLYDKKYVLLFKHERVFCFENEDVQLFLFYSGQIPCFVCQGYRDRVSYLGQMTSRPVLITYHYNVGQIRIFTREYKHVNG